jgi:hypothetical protein
MKYPPNIYQMSRRERKKYLRSRGWRPMRFSLGRLWVDCLNGRVRHYDVAVEIESLRHGFEGAAATALPSSKD